MTPFCQFYSNYTNFTLKIHLFLLAQDSTNAAASNEPNTHLWKMTFLLRVSSARASDIFPLILDYIVSWIGRTSWTRGRARSREEGSYDLCSVHNEKKWLPITTRPCRPQPHRLSELHWDSLNLQNFLSELGLIAMVIPLKWGALMRSLVSFDIFRPPNGAHPILAPISVSPGRGLLQDAVIRLRAVSGGAGGHRVMHEIVAS